MYLHGLGQCDPTTDPTCPGYGSSTGPVVTDPSQTAPWYAGLIQSGIMTAQQIAYQQQYPGVSINPLTGLPVSISPYGTTYVPSTSSFGSLLSSPTVLLVLGIGIVLAIRKGGK